MEARVLNIQRREYGATARRQRSSHSAFGVGAFPVKTQHQRTQKTASSPRANKFQPDDHFSGFERQATATPRTNMKLPPTSASDASRFAFDPDGYSDESLMIVSGTLQQLGVNCRRLIAAIGAAGKIPAANGGNAPPLTSGSPDPVR